jgi:hypothetical protein
MLDASCGGARQSRDQSDVNHSLVSYFVSLIDHVQNCLPLIE